MADTSPPEAAEQAAEQAPDSVEQYLAGELAEQPAEGAVAVSAELRGDYDADALATQLHDLFEPLGQPYQVLATEAITGIDTDLAVLAEEVDRDALYVLFDSNGNLETLERGVSLDADVARSAVSAQRDSGDRSIRAAAEVFTETLTGENGSAAEDSDSPAGSAVISLPPVVHWDLTHAGHAAQFGTVVGLVSGLAVAGVLLSPRRLRRSVLFKVFGAVPVALVAGGTALVYNADTERVEAEEATAAANAADPTYRAEESNHTEEPPYVPDTTRLETASADLTESRVYVDPTAAGALAPDEAGALAERAVDTEAFVVVAQLNSTDESDGDPNLFLHALHAVHGDDGAYLLVEPSDHGARVEAEAFDGPIDVSDISMSLIDINTSDTAAAADAALDAVEQASQGQGEPIPPTLPTPDEPRVGESATTAYFAPGLVSGLGIALVVGFVVALLLRTRQGPASAAQVPLGGTAPDRPSRSVLERMFDEELDQLRSAVEVESAGTKPSTGNSRAVDVLDAVLLLAAADPDPDDLVGMVVLSRRGVLLAAGDSHASARVCTHNPLHGAVVRPERDSGSGSDAMQCRGCREGTPSTLTLEGPRESAPFWTDHDYGADAAATAQAIRHRLGVA